MRHLRILIVTQDFPPPTSGGYGVMAADVCRALIARGHDVEVLTAAANGERQESAHPPNVVRRLETYYKDGECVFPSLDDAAEIERHNLTVIGERFHAMRPDVVSFWHERIRLSRVVMTSTA